MYSLSDEDWGKRYDKMRAIAAERKQDRESYETQPRKCCEDNDVKMVMAHGFWDSDGPHFELGQGYTVIMLCEPGKKLALSKRKLDELRKIYQDGYSFFENNDTNPSEVTRQGINWFNGVDCPCIARLYLGGKVQNLQGEVIPTMVPNVLLEFGDQGTAHRAGHCDNWSGGINPTNPKSTECKITCINPGNQSYCDKYYFDNGSNVEDPDPKYRPFDPHWDTKPAIDLETLIKNEGPGTYVIISCMGGHKEVLPEESARMAEHARAVHLLDYPVSPKYDPDFRKWNPGRGRVTRRIRGDIEKSMDELRRRYTKKIQSQTIERKKQQRQDRLSTLRSRGGKKCKTKKHKRHKTRKHKKSKI